MGSFSPYQQRRSARFLPLLAIAMLLFATVFTEVHGATVKLQSASYKNGTLLVNGTYQGSDLPTDGLALLYDAKLGTWLGQVSLAELPVKRKLRKLVFNVSSLADIPCSVRLAANNTAQRLKKVKGAPKGGCSLGGGNPSVPSGNPASPASGASNTGNSGDNRKRNRDPDPLPLFEPPAPRCEILSPAGGTKLQVSKPVEFRARVTVLDESASPLTYEWDFAGGALFHPSGSLPGSAETKTQVNFVRDNHAYRVRFAAIDQLGKRCEAAVEVVVGAPPAGLLPKVAEQTAPGFASELDGKKGDVVVLPVEEWSFQCINDHYNQPNINTVFPWAINNLGATVYRKDRLPPLLKGDSVEVVYSAASNPNDPAAPNSINSTSQNWPLGAYVREAAIAKTDLWERVDRRGATDLAADYSSRFWIWQFTGGTFGYPRESLLLDEGMQKTELNPGHGRYMPGIKEPYVLNEPQEFSGFDAESGRFLARWIPITDIDDQGRVNPFPLMRVQAVDKTSKQVLATTDAVMTAGRDLHCRECHAKGKIAADPNVAWTREAYHSSLYGEDCAKYPDPSQDTGDGSGGCLPVTPDAWSKPTFVEAKNGTFEEQEWAALLNVEFIHDFYDYAGVFISDHIHSEDGLRHDDGSFACDGCHGSPIRNWPASSKESIFELWTDYFAFEKYGNQTSKYYAKPATVSYHGIHAMFQKNPDGSLKREANGKPALWKPDQGSNPNTLFPVVDDQGNSLPMEQNCLQCHSGQREQCYRDRMYTAGVTCYDCHGDMQAMGSQHKKPVALKSADGNNYRVAWYEEPDCGSCHTGDANDGKQGALGFFSAGVLRRAFAGDDLSATPLKPKRDRFAVPVLSHEYPQEDTNFAYDPSNPVKLTTALYRDGKDTHGNVACGACHGGAHAVWPNRDPAANDNVTALQLQGHTGSVLECNVCHSADAFTKKDDLDGGPYAKHSKPGVLGGPHNLHPVNDMTWWWDAEGEIGGRGGWHADYAQKPGLQGEDQCAACHGNDHRGTRLSRAPVDRELKDESSRPVTIKAGTPVSCEVCHSIVKSCKGSPNPTCGVAAD